MSHTNLHIPSITQILEMWKSSVITASSRDWRSPITGTNEIADDIFNQYMLNYIIHGSNT